MAKFKRMTAKQREVYAALRELGEMVVTPNDSRPLAALKRRGLIRYRRIDGVRHAVLRLNDAQQDAVRAHGHNVPREHWALFWPGIKTARQRRKD